jgi:hypothetical protein
VLVVTYVEVFVEGSEDDVPCSDIIGNPLVVVSDDLGELSWQARGVWDR